VESSQELDDAGYALAVALNFSCHAYGYQFHVSGIPETWKYVFVERWDEIRNAKILCREAVFVTGQSLVYDTAGDSGVEHRGNWR
jgi:hypothetical protein